MRGRQEHHNAKSLSRSNSFVKRVSYSRVGRRFSSSKVLVENISQILKPRKYLAPETSLPSSLEQCEQITRSSIDQPSSTYLLSPELPVLPSTKITINVSGRTFQIELEKLTKYPTTLLGSPELQSYYDPDYKEYFFDRNRDTFESIFDFYLFGKLYPPRGIPEEMYLEEVGFFKMMSLFNVESEDEADTGEAKKPSMCTVMMKATNKALQDPSSSIAGKIWGWLDLFFIALSVVAMITETNPQIKALISVDGSIEQNIAFVVESITVFFFTFDVLIRLTVSEERLNFLRSPATWLDVITVAPYYFELFLDASRFKGLKVLRMARVVRVLKLIKKNKRLLLIAYVMSHSLGELSLLIIVWAMCITVAGSAFYYCEVDVNPKVDSGVDGLWWAVVTMSTVGYGDIVPVTFIGKGFSTVFFYIGMVFLALPLTIIVGAFSKQYENKGTWTLNQRDNKINRLYNSKKKDRHF